MSNEKLTLSLLQEANLYVIITLAYLQQPLTVRDLGTVTEGEG
jgi:hypothetical protein